MTAAYPALALNADFRPITAFPLSIWSFKETVLKFLAGKINVIETYDVVLKHANFEYRPPSVVVLRNYAPQPEAVTFNRMNLFLRDDFTCQYCGQRGTSSDLTFDHVVPRADGGGTSWTNIVAACVPCNSRKGSSRSMKPRVQPRSPTLYEMARKQPIDLSRLHRSSLDYLYWLEGLHTD